MKRLICILATVWSTLSFAQSIEIIVPFSAGGAYDIVARKFEKFLTDENESAVVTVIPGAGGLIGLKKLETTTRPSIIITSSSLYAHAVDEKISLDNYKTISVFADTSLFLVVTKQSGLTCEKIRTPSLTYFIGTAGKDSQTSIPAAWLTEKYKHIVDVPYKGVSQAMTDVVTGQIQMTFIAGYIVNRPDLVILANTSSKSIDGIPTLTQCLGIPHTMQSHFVMLANSSASDEFVQKMNRLALKFTKDPETMKYFKDQGMRVRASDVANATKIVQEDYIHWKKVLNR